MAVVSIARLSELKGSRRIDASRYQPKFLLLEKKLRSIESIKPLVSVIREPVSTGSTPRDREFLLSDYESTKICFIKTDTLREGSIIFENADYLPSRSVKKSDLLQSKDVLVTIIGATLEIVGRTAIYVMNPCDSVVNQNIAVVRTDEKILDPFYLSVFLNSKYGKEQIWMISRQTEQVNLNCREVEEVLVPIFNEIFQKRIGSLYNQSLNLIFESKRLFAQAEKTLLQKLNLDSFSPKRELTYISNFSEIVLPKRFDAEYYQPSFKEIIKRLRERNCSTLLDFVDSIPDDFVPTKHSEESFSYVELADIDTSIGMIDGSKNVTGSDAPSRAGRKVSKNDVLVSAVKGSLKQVAIVTDDYDGALASTGFFQLRIRKGVKLHPEVLLVIAKSLVMQSQLEREATGTILTSVSSHSPKRIVIPLLPDSAQEEIKELVEESHSKWKKGNETFALARKATDLAVDEGEKEALALLDKLGPYEHIQKVDS